MATGLSRMGWDLGILPLSLHHGAIMVGGFLGTLISLEKVIPLKHKFPVLIPLLSGMSVLAFFLDQPEISLALLVTASAGLSAVFLYYLVQTRDRIYFLMLCGGLCWLVGNLTLMDRNFYPIAFPWWMGFILFIITAERMELTQFLPVPTWAKQVLIAILFVFLGGLVWSFHGWGRIVCGVALITVSVWLMKYDIIGISIKKSGLPRFIATSLLCGYIAMLLTGVFVIALRDLIFAYDAVVHTFFLGFTFSMIFAHGPVILPGVLGISAKPWHPILYVWLATLHISLAARVVADLTIYLDIRRITGWASSIAILGYFVTLASLTIRSQRVPEKIL